MPASDHTTAAFDRCVAAARAMAWSAQEDVDVGHLLLAVMFTDDRFARSRLTLRALGVHHFLTGAGYADFAAAVAGIDVTPRVMTRTTQAAAVLDRVAYWARRTGDETADTVHLLLACMEEDDGVKLFGISQRDVVREAMTVRFHISPADRQARHRGPILSAARPGRPPSYLFESLRSKSRGPRKMSSIRHRSQHPSAVEVASPARLYLFRIHLWWHVVLAAAAVAELTAVVLAIVLATPWAAVWLVGSTTRYMVPTWGRLLVLAALAAVSPALGVPWWPVAGSVLIFLLITVEGRFAVLEVKADVADPGVRLRDLRRDARLNNSAAGWYGELKLKRNLAAE
ncbi:MAG TPA: Clp protease N-terminal domain-containing protein [Kribbella sp.]|nr:Clp protease N-terminal domain-containing protein [Kribbella sp.]